MIQFQALTRKPVFWIFQILGFLLCTYLALRLYPLAFPVVDLEIKMDRLSALSHAKELALNHHWGPQNFRQSTSFDLDNQTQTFVELSSGGPAAFSQLLKGGLYQPYTWKVRHFAEGQTNETWVRFTPQGKFYGFAERLAENQVGAALSADEALKIAEAQAQNEWKVPLSEYKLIEKSQETQISKRIDHTFVYERIQEKIGEGRYRLKLEVSGDRLTEIRHFIKIPNAFSRKYGEMRSANNTISMLASISMAILYLFGGCGLGLFFLARKNKVIWKTPLIFAGIVAGFQLLEQINQSPLAWLSYDTAISSNVFFLQKAAMAGLQFLLELFLLSISFMAAESLSRQAFPKHPQFWRIWYPENAGTLGILGRTAGGYLSVGFFFLFVTVIYMVGTRYLGWWSPSDSLFQPDGLATYCPWFTSISNSLHAGFWEECLFRAVPLAGAALLGNHFGKRKAWLTLGFIVQALIFAAAHANYPAQPSYARVIELIIPSFIFGGLYLSFGLLPGIILHYTFDVISFAIPLFATSTPTIWIDRSLVILISLLPLWIVLYSRWKTKRWRDLAPAQLNGGWTPLQEAAVAQEKARHHQVHALTRKTVYGLFTFSLIGIVVWAFFIPFKNDAPSLNITRDQAIHISRQALENNQIKLTPEWEPLAYLISTPDKDDQFIWKTESKDLYHQLMGTYLAPPSWVVRYVRFNTEVAERAEEYQVYLARDGEAYRIRHDLPEARAGAELEQTQARTVALQAIQKRYGFSIKELKEISNNASQLPKRRDWHFVFQDPSIPLKVGETRIAVRVSGDQVTAMNQFVFIPEQWERSQRNRENVIGLVTLISSVLLVAILVVGVVFAVISWTKKNFSSSTFWTSFGLFSVLGILYRANHIQNDLAHLSTIEPKFNQFLAIGATSLLSTFSFSSCEALLMGLIHERVKYTVTLPKKISIITGISTGICLTLIVFLSSQLLPASMPTWGSLEGLNVTIPAFIGLEKVDSYIAVTLLFLLVGIFTIEFSNHWQKRTVLCCSILFLIGLALSAINASDFAQWFLVGTVGGLNLALIFRYIFQANLSLIPLTSGMVFCLLEWRQIKLHPYPGFTLNRILSVLMILVVSFFWYMKLNKKAHSPIAKTQ